MSAGWAEACRREAIEIRTEVSRTLANFEELDAFTLKSRLADIESKLLVLTQGLKTAIEVADEAAKLTDTET